MKEPPITTELPSKDIYSTSLPTSGTDKNPEGLLIRRRSSTSAKKKIECGEFFFKIVTVISPKTNAEALQVIKITDQNRIDNNGSRNVTPDIEINPEPFSPPTSNRP